MKNIPVPENAPGPDESVAAPIAADSVTPRSPRDQRAATLARDGRPGSPDKFAVVALCGSAGALEAFEKFFAHLPPLSGLALVVVVHRPAAPAHGEQLTQVLQRFTLLPVAEATDGLRVRPNHVYVIPADHDLSLLHGCLYLLKPTQPASRRQPIDFFLQTLAKDVGERAVCVICSGLGADGTVGLKLIMENFGMVMVQDPATAQFDAMPRAALATEFVDFMLPPERLPAQLLDYLVCPLGARPAARAAASPSQPGHALQKIFLLIRSQTGHDFSFYKRNTVFRRIERRMNSHQIKDFTQYVRYLQENPGEVEQLFHELLIGVTKFFRDAEAFASLKALLRPLLAAKETDGPVRVWAPGCSTGEEAYSLAMTLLECLDELKPDGHHLRLQIFATDISPGGIAFARAGLYRENITADVSPERLARFFQKTDDHYQIRKEVRDVVVFALHNLNKDAPFIKLDLLVCRNLLIYLSAELQKSLLPIFHYALNANGLLFLGPSENITGYQDLFQPLDVKWKISRRTSLPAALPHVLKFAFARQAPASPTTALMSASASANHRQTSSFASLVQKKLLQAYAPPAVVIDAKGEILYVNGRIGKYLEPAPGLSGMNLFEMAREEPNFEISGAVHRATQTHQDVVVDNVRVRTDAGQQVLRLSVQHLAGLLLVVFEDQPTPRRLRVAKSTPSPDGAPREALVALDKELQHTKHRLQTTVEEMESSLEELKSTNEELQSANEELQSTNEEAMTNKEEMQSLNEELMTLNMQYLAKTEELGQTANDMKNLLDATEIAIIFLDNDLVIKRFTPPVGRIISLVPADVGRPLAHFTSSLRYEHLLRDVQQVLDRLTVVETNIQTTRGEWYALRILPYRSLDNYTNGAVLTFTDITALKVLETRLQDHTRFTDSLQDGGREPQLTLDAQLRVLGANPAFAHTFGEPLAGLPGRALASLSGAAWRQPALHQQLRRLLDETSPSAEFEGFVLEAEFPGLGRRRALLYGRRVLHQGQPTHQLMLGVRALEEV
ncbi:chemotaxis protein CheB [Hymenobacter arcticus]